MAFRVFSALLEAEGRAGRSADPRPASRIIVCDINPAMLQVGRQRAKARGKLPCLVLNTSQIHDRAGGLQGAGWEHATELEWMTGDAEALQLENESVDSYTVAFGVRNMTHIRTALAEAHR